MFGFGLQKVFALAMAASVCCGLFLAYADNALDADMGMIKKYIPKDYGLYSFQTGDLNMDKQTDMLVVLEKQSVLNNIASDREELRPLLIFTRKNGKLHFVGRNDHVVLCKICGGIWGDPFQSIVIKDGFFSIEHYGGSNWRWTIIITFRYYPKNSKWFLWKQGGDSFHTSAPNTIETKVKSQKDFGLVSFEEYNFDNIK